MRDDAQANRDVLLGTLRLVSIPAAAVILVAGFFGYRSVEDLKASLETDARQSTQAEIGKMQNEIRKTLSDQFQTPTIQKTVREAAVEATTNAAEPLIKSEVSTQVKSSVAAQRPMIESNITKDTKAAVAEMEPNVDALVKDSVDTKVTNSVNPVIQHVKDEADLLLLVNQMNSDDANAYDKLTVLGESGDPGQRTFINSTLQNVVSSHNSGLSVARSFGATQTFESLVKHLKDVNPLSREMALGSLSPFADPSSPVLPLAVTAMESDSSINVRCAATRLFNQITQASLRCLDKEAYERWRAVNRAKFPNIP